MGDGFVCEPGHWHTVPCKCPDQKPRWGPVKATLVYFVAVVGLVVVLSVVGGLVTGLVHMVEGHHRPPVTPAPAMCAYDSGSGPVWYVC